MNEQSILVLGGPKSGKTLYGAQLILRLAKDVSALKFYAQPSNLELFQEPMECLARGRLANHTPRAVSKDIELPIELAGNNRVRVVWPDYGGEQVSQLIRSRVVPASWKERAVRATGWLVMVRPELFKASRDLLHRPLKDLESKRGDATSALPEWMPETGLVELLQILLFMRRTGREVRITLPRLVVAISCWDEMDSGSSSVRPSDELRRVMPMLANFVDGTWSAGKVTVVGISALGKPLSADTDDTDFVDLGPHRQGFVVLPDGLRSPDLTWPLKNLLV